MENLSLVGRRLLQVGLLTVFVAATASLNTLHSQTIAESGGPPTSDSTAKVVLEVVNNHFTVGMKIPSVYLRLFSDGTAECHTVKFTGKEEDTVRKAHLEPREFAEVITVLNQPALRDLKGRYDLPPRMIIDSWMEWDLRIHGSRLVQDVTVTFGPTRQRIYPEALGKLGCQIVKIREYVYGDRTDYYRPACVNHSPQK